MLCEASTPDELAFAIEANHDDVYLNIARQVTGVTLDIAPDRTLCYTGLPHPSLNMVLASRMTTEQALPRILEAIAFFKARATPMTWMVTERSQPMDLVDQLLDCGLLFRYSMPGMARPIRGTNCETPEGLEVGEVLCGEDMKAHCQLVGTGFGLNWSIVPSFEKACLALGWGPNSSSRHFYVKLGGEMIGVSTLQLSQGIAGVYSVATRPDCRGRGIGTLMTQVAMNAAQEMGYQMAGLQASSMGLAMYRRMGFRQYCRFDVYGMNPSQT